MGRGARQGRVSQAGLELGQQPGQDTAPRCWPGLTVGTGARAPVLDLNPSTAQEELEP